MTDAPIEKGARPQPPSSTPKEFQGSHSPTDAQIDRDFAKAFQPLPTPTESAFTPPHIPEPEGGPEEYTLPARTVIYDEDGNEIDRLTEPTLVRGYRKRESGKATFTFNSRLPLGRENAPQRVNGVARRFGNLWFGQTPEDLKEK